MLFNTIDFIVFFIVVLSTFVIVKNRKFQHLFLLLASYFFFYYTSNYLIALLIFTTIWDYYFGKAIWSATSIKKKKALLLCSLAGNLGLLGYFKYADFAIAQFNILGHSFNLADQIPSLNLVFPIGISFYTFHSITYTVSIYRGLMSPTKSFTEYAIFVAFFPQLVAGPIMRAKEFLPQLREKAENLEISSKLRQIVIQESNLKIGVTLMTFGFLKKMFFADNLSPMVNEIFSAPHGLESFTIILGAITFGVQIYCDFSGYTDIAIGAALIMGFKLPPNFNKPFFATSPTDFWRRWHISLSTWVRDYLYLPLVFSNRKSSFRILTSLMITFTLLGLWHGAGWNYVIFGVLHGIYVTADTLVRKRFPSLEAHRFFKTKIGKLTSILLTQYFVVLAFIAFRVQDLNDMLYSMQKYVIMDFQYLNTIAFIKSHVFEFVVLFLFLVLHITSYKKENLRLVISNNKLYFFSFILFSSLLILCFLGSNAQEFIYFHF